MSKAHNHVLVDEYILADAPRLNFAAQIKLFQCFLIRKSKYLLFLADSVLLLLFFSIASTSANDQVFLGILFLNLIWGFIGYIRNYYSFVLIEEAEVIIRHTLNHWITFFFLASVFYSIIINNIFAAKPFYLFLLGFGISTLAVRVIFLSIRKYTKSRIVKKRKIAFIGQNVYSDQLENYFKEGFSDYQIHSRYETSEINLYKNDYAPYTDIFYMAQQGINEIYCCFSSLKNIDIQQLLKEADKYMIRVKLLPDYSSVFNRPFKLEPIGDVPVITVRPEPLGLDRNKLLKRTFDIIFSLGVIIFILSWLLPIIWLIIRLESKGPLFFKQKRSGLDNHVFDCYKFRSMVANNKSSDTQQATINDKRITKVGAFLRKTSLDELPQFFNVLIGNMSVVGPRPHMLAHTDQYRRLLDTYMIRHYVKPGITGLAQISGCRGETKEVAAMQRRVEHDIIYVENWSFLQDLKIIFLTVWNIIRGEENAY
ncbi:MAG: undecaprenyl-phosphate glucose phosphotransferase [Sphingobacteriales bacterium]|jgi:putative colanic acid biosynthesis UDP-glucose lipid carrier transferase|nr:undecaprenyl-phosphate glucose phosphotransferase [Sphingobacteriales bacterium]